MNSLVLANLMHRKTRTLVTIFGVALGVVLTVLTVGLINGFLNAQGKRNAAVTAEIMVRPAGGGFGLGFESTSVPSLPVKLVDELRAVEGVTDAVPVMQYFQSLQMIDGIEYESFAKVSELRVIAGKPARDGDEMMIDRIVQRDWKLKIGDSVKVFDRPFRVTGIYEPESLGRFKIPLQTLQDGMNRPHLCSMILVKVTDPEKEDEIAGRIKEQFPQTSLMLTRDLQALFARGTPPLQVFRRVVIALSVGISTLVILLTMYTTVTERTRLIGVLKSLGASKSLIAGEIEKEAVVICICGLLLGFALSFAGKWLIEKTTPLKIELQTMWFFYALLVSLLSAALGALYPALRAANQDPVKALSYE